MLLAFSSPPFYTTYVRLPEEDEPIPTPIYNDPRYHPFFDHALGAADGSHIVTALPWDERSASRNRKGGISQNVFATCTLDTLLFTYVLSGIEGSATDSTVFQMARQVDFRVPGDRYYLADAGYGFVDLLLVPYRGVRYHLAEWGRAGLKPVNKEELFNLRHAKLRNAIERIFGILKKRFPILRAGCEYDMKYQVRLPPALCALHNFIRIYDPSEIQDFQDVQGDPDRAPQTGELAEGPATRAERSCADSRRDYIAQTMWESYQGWLRQAEAGEDEQME
ncbi:hypothetical protein BN946_scf184835.g1 [Trametes cinnabarina]|uniref:DDE Tnp4 domain-containing protein n=1 Tax=Pycnoporus cinnabarinus TaxID=5643 RepID=A0A060SYR7_PYCCI|nr:hypothetical protein BN946_scf184835.g1 [Trametes cinnabarina]